MRNLAALPAAWMANKVLITGVFPTSLEGANYHSSAMKKSTYRPGYIDMHESGELKARSEILYEKMRRCTLCPRDCETDRLSGQRGDCNANGDLEISSISAHFGEEEELVGRNGSGTVFFTNCSLLCVFCINYDVSQLGHGQKYNILHLAEMMLTLQNHGCHNINVVTPTHYIPHILMALDRAVPDGLNIPLVYNTSGWEKTDILAFLDGIVDVYLSDFKYADAEAADTYSPGAKSYPELTKKAILEMHRQVGVAQPDPDTGLINKGLMIRHLVMPENVIRSDKVIQWVAKNLPSDTYINIMSQYTPMFKAHDYPEISRRITRSEYNEVVRIAREEGLSNFRQQMR